MLSRLIWATLLAGAAALAQQDTANPENALVRDILRELIETNTTHSTGSTGLAAEKMAARLRDAGFPAADIEILGPRPERNNLVARIHGTGKERPILLIAHLDVVEANRADWTTDPFQFVEKDGFYYGRGTSDIKEGDAILVANFIRWQKEGYRPDRDLIMALTADEEGGTENGIAWLLANRRQSIDAGYCINLDGGALEIKGGKKVLNEVQYSEKGFLTFILEAKDKGGHSSVPRKHNAIYELAEALVRLSAFEFPVMLDEGRREYLRAVAVGTGGKTAGAIARVLATDPPDPGAVRIVSESPDLNAELRTTCVATMVQAGHAENALPQSARATVNCRILPGQPAQEVQQTVRRVIDDSAISIATAPDSPIDDVGSPPSPLNPEVMKATKAVTESMWPGVPVVPVMSRGASDGRILRVAGMPVYGISGIADDQDDIRAHGKDERVGVTAVFEGREFVYQLVKALAGK
jgi:acetylornithine deacetylase/succinyl-diaminopimelate desuccinylase-like protein